MNGSNILFFSLDVLSVNAWKFMSLMSDRPLENIFSFYIYAEMKKKEKKVPKHFIKTNYLRFLIWIYYTLLACFFFTIKIPFNPSCTLQLFFSNTFSPAITALDISITHEFTHTHTFIFLITSCLLDLCTF